VADLAETLEEHWDAMLAQSTRVPFAGSVTELVNQLGGPGRGGGTRAAADAMGVVIRDIQRWTNWEKGLHTPSNRDPANMRASTREKLEEAITRAPEAALARELKRDGMTVTRAEGPIDFSGDYPEKRRVIRGDWHIDGADLAGFLDLAVDGNWGAAAQAWDAAFFDAYGVPAMGFTDLQVNVLALRMGE
jgi:hypothetical protein